MGRVRPWRLRQGQVRPLPEALRAEVRAVLPGDLLTAAVPAAGEVLPEVRLRLSWSLRSRGRGLRPQHGKPPGRIGSFPKLETMGRSW